MPPAAQNYYRILGVPEDASPDEVAGARRSMLKAVHPDLATSETDRVERERLSRMVNEICDTLLDPVTRWDYDRTLARTRRWQDEHTHPSDAETDPARETDPATEDDRWEPEATPGAGAPWSRFPGLASLEAWLTWRVAGLSVVMLGLSVLVYDTVGGRALDRMGLHFGRFGSVAVVLVWTVLLVAVCLGVARWLRARRTGPG